MCLPVARVRRRGVCPRQGELNGAYPSLDGLTTASNTTESAFTGAGPRVGIKGQYAIGDFAFFGEAAGAGLDRHFAESYQFLGAFHGGAQPRPAQQPGSVLAQRNPGGAHFDARFGTVYAFPPTSYGQFKIEVGYQAAVFMNAINQYVLEAGGGTSRPSERGRLPGDRQPSSKQLHHTRPVPDGKLGVLAQLSQLGEKSQQYQRTHSESRHYATVAGARTVLPGAVRGGGCGGRSSLSCRTSTFCSAVSSV